MTAMAPLTATQARLKELEAGGPLTTWADPSIIDSTDIEVIARCGDRKRCLPDLPQKRELETIALALERAGLAAITPCCARASRRLVDLLPKAA